jgi:hypothetical protein
MAETSPTTVGKVFSHEESLAGIPGRNYRMKNRSRESREGFFAWRIARGNPGKEFSYGKSLPQIAGRNFTTGNRSRKLREGISLRGIAPANWREGISLWGIAPEIWGVYSSFGETSPGRRRGALGGVKPPAEGGSGRRASGCSEGGDFPPFIANC